MHAFGVAMAGSGGQDKRCRFLGRSEASTGCFVWLFRASRGFGDARTGRAHAFVSLTCAYGRTGRGSGMGGMEEDGSSVTSALASSSSQRNL